MILDDTLTAALSSSYFTTHKDEGALLRDLHKNKWHDAGVAGHLKVKPATARGRIRELNMALGRLYAKGGELSGSIWGIRIEPHPYHLRCYRLHESDQVDAAEFARLLNAFCRLEQIAPSERTSRYQKWRANEENTELHGLASSLTAPDQVTLDEFLKFLRVRNRPLKYKGLASLAAQVGVRGLLLYPLLSIPKDAVGLTFDFQDNFRVCEGEDVKSPEYNAEYAIPRHKLRNTDAVFVRVTLPKGGRSDKHAHPGTEIALVMSGGPVDIEFEQTGLTTKLEQGDTIHFYAEATHQIVAKEKAELFVIRFYGLEETNTREAMWDELQRLIGDAETREARLQSLLGEPTTREALWDQLREHGTLSPQGRAWIRESFPRWHPESAEGSGDTKQVQDALGLARFVKHCGTPFATEGGLTNEERQAIEAVDPHVMDSLDLDKVAISYGLNRFLIEGFRSPAVPGATVLRHKQRDKWHKGDFRAVEHCPKGVSYAVPSRNLLCSDISLAVVEMDPGALTETNSHRGFEGILMLEGSIELRLDTVATPLVISANRCQLCHFNSSVAHSVSNTGAMKARFLVVRFHRDGPASAPNGHSLQSSNRRS